MSFVLWFLFQWSPHAIAQEAAAPKTTVWVHGSPEAVQAVLPAEYFEIETKAKTDQKRREHGYLYPSERDAIFRKVGIEGRIQNLDQYDRDMLVLRARHYNVSEMKKQYPMLALEQLKALKDELGKGPK